MRAVTIDSDLATLFTFTPRKTPITPIQGVPCLRLPRACASTGTHAGEICFEVRELARAPWPPALLLVGRRSRRCLLGGRPQPLGGRVDLNRPPRAPLLPPPLGRYTLECHAAQPPCRWPFSSRSRASVGARRLPPPLLPP